MKSLFSFLICGLLFTNVISAQNESKVPSKYTETQKGIFRQEYYNRDIRKFIYEPSGYQKNDKITNAVVEKPNRIETNGTNILKGRATLLYAQGSDKHISISVLPDTNGFRGFRFNLEEGEQIFGGGERALPLNRRGYRFNLYNNPWYGYSEGADNLNFSVPFFTSSKGYGLFFDNGSKGYADIGKSNPFVFEVGFLSGEINVYVIFGETYQEILTSYQKLTGFQPMPPKWAMGNFMSRFGYTSEKQTKEIAANMRAEKIPFDAVIFDLFWFGDSIKNTLGNIDWVNKTKWPNPKQMIADLKKDNLNSILITEPFFLKETKSYPFAEQYLAKDSVGKAYQLQDFYFGKGGLLDIFRKDAGNWLWNYHYKKQIANGVAGWWTDLGEPEKHPSDMLHNLKDLGVNRMMQADEVHNLYGHYWNKMLFDNYAKEFPNTRLFHLNRSGFSGSQRYSIFPWTGDISRSWSGLRAQLPNVLGMSMSGIPYIHSDAGGFAMGEGDAELYLRWLQFSLFTPIFRPHGTALFEVDPKAFSYPSEPALADKSVLEYIKKIVDQRYQLVPYNYTLAYRQAAFGEPLIKPLYYQYQNDSSAVKIGDQFMWGDAFMIAPVIVKGQKFKEVYLPEGKWYDFNTHQFYAGKQIINFSTEDFMYPVLVKAGSFIPQYSYRVKNTVEQKDGIISVLYVPSENASSYQLYLDDGVSKNAISSHQYELIDFKTKGRTARSLEITIASNGGKYLGKPSKEKIGFQIPGVDQKPLNITINDQSVTILDATDTRGISTGEQAIWNLGKQHELLLPVGFNGKTTKIIIKW
ncbi:MAG: TIM-barrel domain-containing protein [Bacteroidota bacterium]